MIIKDTKVVLVVGASSGLGLSVANALHNNGNIVIAGARSFNNDEKISNYIKIHLDVCDINSCIAAVKYIVNKYKKIDSIIYCAGKLIFGPCESLSSKDYLDIMQTNFLGITNILNEVIPIMRNQNNGKIIVFSSINGIISTPFQSAYVASKHAIEGYVKCLYNELKQFNISVSMVRPGDHKSGSIKYRNKIKSENIAQLYDPYYEKTVKKVLYDEENGSSALKLGDIIAKYISKDKIPLIITIAKPSERLALLLMHIIPTKLFYNIIRKYYLK